MGLLLAGIHALLTLAWFAIVIVSANAARRWLAHTRSVRIIDRVACTVMIGLGTELALQHP